jgi:tetrahydromethanopterin S-methyltransferase subunit F
MPDGLKADAKLGFGVAIGFFLFALVLVGLQLALARVRK